MARAHLEPPPTHDDARAARPTRRRLPGWVPLGLVAWGLSVGIGALADQLEAEGFDLIDPARVAIETDARFVDERWERALVARLVELDPFPAQDADARARLGEALLDLPFVAEVEPPRLVWPDGVSVRLRYERPVATIAHGGAYLCVSDTGRVLPGGWSRPPEVDGLPLPVLGRLGADEPDSPPGSSLARSGLWHALSVALSMELHLTREERALLGPVVIDGENGAVGLVDDPGAVLWLEGRRVALFGRTPDVDAPGELPVATKWRHLSDALVRQERGELEWRAVDLRWDRYAVAGREDAPAPERAVWRSAVERRTQDGSGSGPARAARPQGDAAGPTTTAPAPRPRANPSPRDGVPRVR